MKKFKKADQVELKPLNEDIYDEFSIQELEQRLETKPWICGGNCNDFDVEIPEEQILDIPEL
ncbi:MAG: hypothetical protein MK198_09605 [Gracilimonas sp.]|uniref:hypothetical protein n=1 Tax=Gracilimonas sp. TaxID=1974203 RepID=UPI0037525920|nr:hypothetical protein [Gracilimonas sp.]